MFVCVCVTMCVNMRVCVLYLLCTCARAWTKIKTLAFEIVNKINKSCACTYTYIDVNENIYTHTNLIVCVYWNVCVCVQECVCA